MLNQVEHIRKEFYRNSGLADHGLGLTLTAIADVEYHLSQLADIEAENGLDFGLISKFAESLADYYAQICRIEHSVRQLLSAIGDYADARESYYRIQ